MKLYALIMAGGIGSRFWPRSKEKMPKQLLKIFGNNTMIQSTVERLNGVIPYENIFVITNNIQRDEIINQLSQIPKSNILVEPFGRNTAACIGFASLLIGEKCKDAVTVVLPADHIIKDTASFHSTLMEAAAFADEKRGLVTIGIIPTRPETGYGYIQIDDTFVKNNIHKVLTFAEKPNYATAVRFLESGDFLWNSGMFIWRIDVILEEIDKLMPELAEGLSIIKQNIDSDSFNEVVSNVYGQLRNTSIDYGIMEKSKKVYLIKGDFGWSDVGSWEEVYQLSLKNDEGNAVVGRVFTDETTDSYIYSPNKFTAVIGAENFIVINTDDALLICRRDKAQDVKKVIDHLKFNKLNDHL
ncbi:MAG: NTP transferase domain-containing protein [Ignavibacteriaceae bacterium]|nr:NTP transferase domain-containing protein [Ignavibacteriaceae bacterium]